MIEATYGDREHPEPGSEEHAALAAAIRRTIRRGGSVVIPAFAVDRTELVLTVLARMLERGVIPAAPIYLDSPMALAALEVYRRAEYQHELRPGAADALERLPGLRAARSADESRALNSPRQPSIIISASGMASGGRVVHHLRHLLPDQRNTVVLTGYQAVGTRGRALADGAHEVKIMGRYVPVRAEVVSDEEFSVHADASGSWAGWWRCRSRRRRSTSCTASRRPPRGSPRGSATRPAGPSPFPGSGSASSSADPRPRASSAGHAQDGGAADVARRHVGERLVGGLEGEDRGRRRQTEPGGEGEELLAVASGVARHRADRALAEEVPLVVQGGMSLMWMPASANVPAGPSDSSASGTRSPAGAKMIAESRGTGAGSRGPPTEAAPSSRARSRAWAPRVMTCTSAPCAMATWAVRCALAPKP